MLANILIHMKKNCHIFNTSPKIPRSINLIVTIESFLYKKMENKTLF